MKIESTKLLNASVVLITGASEGIGSAIAFRMAAEGARLALTARRQGQLEITADRIREATDVEVGVFPADVTDSKQVDALITEVVARFGRLDILVNNVGQGLRKPLVETTDEDWNRLIAVNLSSVFYGCRSAYKQMQRQGGGIIINIASRSGRIGEGDLPAYSAVKHGVVGLTRALAEEGIKDKVVVNVVCPGPVNTDRMARLLPQVDRSAWLTPGDVAEAVMLLAAAPGRVMQGQSIDLF